MEFTPINTQEEFESRVREVYGDVGNLQQQLKTVTGERDTHANTIADLQKQVKGFETAALRQRIAREKGIPPEMADRLSGETEKDIRADADVVAGIFKSAKGPAPLFNPEPKDPNASDANITSMLHELRGE